jgi:copper chaperone
MTTTEISVEGMRCSGCERSISGSLLRMDGVDQASADAEAGRVEVAFDEARVSEDDLRNAIESAGFTAA